MSEFVTCCQISSDVVRFCQVLSDVCQMLSGICQVMPDYVRYLSDTCQILSDTCLRYQYRFCQVLSDSVSYLSDSVRWCQILVRFCQMLSDTILHVTMDRPQAPLCTTLAKGPCAGPSPGAHVQDPRQGSLRKTHARCPGEGPSCCCYCCCNCQATLGEPGGPADFRQQADCMSVAAVIS